MSLTELIKKIVDESVDKSLKKIDEKRRLRVDTRQMRGILEKEEGYMYAYGYLYGKKEAESFIKKRVRRLFTNKNRFSGCAFPYKDMSHVEQLPFEKVKEAYHTTKIKYREDFKEQTIRSDIFYAMPSQIGKYTINNAYINEYGDVIAMGEEGLYLVKSRLDGNYISLDMPRRSIVSVENVKFRLHTLIAATFLNNPFLYVGEPIVHHINGKKLDSHYKNLEYVKDQGVHRAVHHRIECIQAKPCIGENGKRIWTRWDDESLNKRIQMPAFLYGVSVDYIYDMLSREPYKIDKENTNIKYYRRRIPKINGKSTLVELKVTWKKKK
ncbi:hypothetical protein BHF69_07330 [Anaerostipes sp. 992a]|uniref:hypothetical protein n=1 Tax=Anaerostipes sp. 992a TaxID=1261637 RepID=UPI000953480D|nr:hypothetical protein [Anaerostipes sp. 992a]OLR62509.1 hypothetical protein BHF69_07330 [Anaerostipes sp. 992a]